MHSFKYTTLYSKERIEGQEGKLIGYWKYLDFQGKNMMIFYKKLHKSVVIKHATSQNHPKLAKTTQNYP